MLAFMHYFANTEVGVAVINLVHQLNRKVPVRIKHPSHTLQQIMNSLVFDIHCKAQKD